MHCAAARSPNDFLYRSDHAYIWDVLRRLEKILTKKTKKQIPLIVIRQREKIDFKTFFIIISFKLVQMNVFV